MTVLGTRPEIIRLSRIIPVLDQAFAHVVVHTGQNATPALRDQLFDDLGLRVPDVALAMTAERPGAALALIFEGVENAIIRHRPDAMLILGDTHSALACLVARRHGVTVYHMEAGNRCFDRESPEESNRRVVDHCADYNIAYTEAARRNLLREGLHPARIWVTGSPLREVIEFNRATIDRSNVVARLGLHAGGYVLASLHRQESVDRPVRLAALMEALGRIAAQTGHPVVMSTHPRTEDRLRASGIGTPDGVRLCSPFGFSDWCRLQQDAACVVSDSGTVPEEAAMLGFRAVIPRRSIERPEALDTGTVIVAGTAADDIVEATRLCLALPQAARSPLDYGPTDVSRRVAGLIAGTWRNDAACG